MLRRSLLKFVLLPWLGKSHLLSVNALGVRQATEKPKVGDTGLASLPTSRGGQKMAWGLAVVPPLQAEQP